MPEQKPPFPPSPESESNRPKPAQSDDCVPSAAADPDGVINAFFQTADAGAEATDRTAAVSQYCGLIAIVGKPNAGKSTLLNALVGQKVSITSRKAQTTRHRIMGVRSDGAYQFLFVDTPGYQTRHSNALNRALNRTVTGSLQDVDMVLWVTEAGRFEPADEQVLQLLPSSIPVILVANKLDKVRPREAVLPWLKSMQQRFDFADMVPLTAKRPQDAQRLLDICKPYLQEQSWWYAADVVSDRSERFFATEVLREKVFRLTGDELPYSTAVILDGFVQEQDARSGRILTRIQASIVVEKPSHKGMIIGSGGERLKRIGMEARQELEHVWGHKVFLETWVKVKSGWSDDAARVRSYGYD